MTDTFLEQPSEWFITQLNRKLSTPIRLLYIDGEDHSSKVRKWPTIRRDIAVIKPVNVNIELVNTSGEYNDFWTTPYSMNVTCSLYLAFAHENGDREILPIYTGDIKKVSYKDQVCVLYIKDKYFDLSTRKIGSYEDQVSFSQQIPSDIVWTLCTCYGGLSDVASTSNPDIEYSQFLKWSETFSIDQFTIVAYSKGKKIFEMIHEIMDITDSYNYVDHNGRIVFDRLDEVSSFDFIIDDLQWIRLQVDIDAEGLINKQYVNWDYNPTSETWAHQIHHANSSSIDNFGLRENVLESENAWVVSSTDALNISFRRINRYSEPVKNFTIELPLTGMTRFLGETVRLVNSFYNVTSANPWRISEQVIDLSTLKTNISIKQSVTFDRFYLDVSLLDGNDRLL